MLIFRFSQYKMKFLNPMATRNDINDFAEAINKY